jgi:hypothetical protein
LKPRWAAYGIGTVNKVELKRLLDAAIAAAKGPPPAGALASEPAADRPQQAVKDDQSAWDLEPFPDGWYVGC